MREMDFTRLAMQVTDEYQGKLKYADQDILNIIFSLHPQRLFDLPCDWDYLFTHCDSKKVLK